MMLGLLAMAFANAASFLGAHDILERVRTGKTSIDVTLFLLIRLLLISSAVLLAGLVHALNPLALGAVGSLVLVLLLARGAHRRLPRFPWRDLGPGWILLAAILLIRLLVQVWIFAPSFDDALSYHLPKVAEAVRAGAWTSELGSDPRSTFPAGFELVEIWWVVFLHHDVIIEMAGLEFLILAGAALHALASGIGWSPRSARIAALIFVLGPGLHFQATSALNDGAVTALIIGALALIASGVAAPLFLIPVLLGAGIKPTMLLALPGIILLMALLPSRDGSTPVRSPHTAFLLAGSAFAIGVVWYVRNWIVFGNPIHPMGSGGMTSLITGGTLQTVGPSLRSLQENLSAFVDLRIYDAQAPSDGNCTLGFNGGAAAFALGFPSLVALLRTEPLLRRIALGIGVSVCSVFTCVVLDPWNSRFILFVTALPALALGRLWDRHRIVAALGSLALALQVVATCIPGNLTDGTLEALSRQGWRGRAAMPAPSSNANEPIGFCCDDFGPAYPLYRPDYSRKVIYLRETNVDDLLARVDREGVRFLIVSGTLPKRRPMIEEASRRGRLRPFQQGPWKGYEILPPR
jgi:hypothetical protein